MKMRELMNENDMMSFFKDLQKNNPKFKNLRVHGDPEHDELRRQDQEKRDADRQATHQRAQDATAKDHANLPELEAEYARMLAKYKSLGGNGWQYADREQNLTSAEREARSMEHGLHHLHARIAAAKKHGVTESATVGATSAANIGTVVNPHISPGKARGKKSYTGSVATGSGTKAPPQPKVNQPKNSDGTAKNGLDIKGTSLFGGPAVKRG